MKRIIGENITRYRKEKGLTQEDVATQLGITCQAVSKWENGYSAPDVSLLPRLASILSVSIDRIMGYSHNFDSHPYYEEQYNKEEYFWGITPSKMCLKVMELLPPTKPLRLIDIGCGEGKDSVFFARCGYSVTAFDISEAGIEKTKRLADKANVFVDAFKADMWDFRLEQKYDIIFSNGSLQCIKPELRDEIFANYKKYTQIGGINAMQCIIHKPFIHEIPGKQSGTKPWRSGELLTMYHDWFIEESEEYVFNCNSGGVPHKHAANKVYARKMG